MTGEAALVIYETRLKGNASLKPRTVFYYQERIKALRKSWPLLFTQQLRQVTKGNCPAKPASRPAARPTGNGEQWACSPKQKELILKIVADARLDFREIEHLAQERFSLAVKALNKMQASNLIDELLSKYGGKPQGKPAYGKGGRT